MSDLTSYAMPHDFSSTVHAAPLKVGSDAHRDAFCNVLTGTFDPYKPSILAWPKLSTEAESRLKGLPFWDLAVQTEGFAASRMQAMADTIQDAVVREALTLNAFEEGRHKLVIRNMLQFYRIPIADDGSYVSRGDAEWKFIRTGYGECFDSFFAFGLFHMAKESGFFPPELVEVFEPVIQEEARHILFFVNWVAWTAARRPFMSRLRFRLRCLASLTLAGFERLSLAGVAAQPNSDNFVVAGGASLTVDLTPRRLIEIALAENDRRLAPYDPRLRRPAIMPFFGRLALRLLPKAKIKREG